MAVRPLTALRLEEDPDFDLRLMGDGEETGGLERVLAAVRTRVR